MNPEPWASKDYFAPFRLLQRMRRDLAELKPLDDYGLFARSMVSGRDATLIRRVARETPSTEVAGRIFLELFTMGGVGNLTADMSTWLSRDEDDSDLFIQAGIVLAALVRDLADGTALRALFEFRDHDDIHRNLDRIREDLPDERIGALLRMSLSEQIADRLDGWGANPGARGLWLLRTYVGMSTVQEYLTRFIARGSVSALASYFFADKIVAWKRFNQLKLSEPCDTRIAINLAVENVGRGASSDDLRRGAFFQSLSAEDQSELFEGLTAT